MNRQHLEVVSGENRTLTGYARDSSNAVANLTSKTITVYVGVRPNDPDRSGAVFTKTGTVTSASGGIFTFPVTPGDTNNLEGDYEWQAKTTDGSGNIAVVAQGRFRILPDITA